MSELYPSLSPPPPSPPHQSINLTKNQDSTSPKLPPQQIET